MDVSPVMPPVAPPIARDTFALDDDIAYLDTAYACPLPVAAAEAIAADARDAALRGSAALGLRAERLSALRSTWAGLVGSHADDIALTANTTHGLGVVAAGLDWAPGDVVLVAEGDHPTTVLPWRAQEHRGVTVRAVPLGALPEAVASVPRVRVVAVSWVQAHDGARTDLARLAAAAHGAGAALCVDVIQGAGVVPCDLAGWGVDAAAAGAQKWLLGPHGIGLVHLAPALRDRLAPWTLSRASVEAGQAGTAARFEAGAPNHAGVAGAQAGAEILATAGIDTVWAWVDHLTARLRAGIAAAGLTVVSPPGEARSALVTVAVPGVAADDVVARLRAAGVVASARGEGIRFAPAGWTTVAEVDRAVDTLRSL